MELSPPSKTGSSSKLRKLEAEAAHSPVGVARVEDVRLARVAFVYSGTKALAEDKSEERSPEEVASVTKIVLVIDVVRVEGREASTEGDVGVVSAAKLLIEVGTLAAVTYEAAPAEAAITDSTGEEVAKT